MMAVIILFFSIAALLQFFVSYSRALIASSSRRKLSLEVQDVTGITESASGEDFARVVQLLRLCPEVPEDRNGLPAVSAYYGFLSLVQSSLARIVPSLRAWVESERAQCAYFAAVALDQRISFSRDMLAQQMST